MIDEADRDGDGEVNQQEFLRIMKKTCLYWGKRGWFLRVMLLIYLLQTHYCVVPYISILNKVWAVIFSTERKLFRTWTQRLVKCQIILLWVTWKSHITFAKKKKTKNRKRVLSCLECCIILTIQVNSQCLCQHGDKHSTFRCFDW